MTNDTILESRRVGLSILETLVVKNESNKVVRKVGPYVHYTKLQIYKSSAFNCVNFQLSQ